MILCLVVMIQLFHRAYREETTGIHSIWSAWQPVFLVAIVQVLIGRTTDHGPVMGSLALKVTSIGVKIGRKKK